MPTTFIIGLIWIWMYPMRRRLRQLTETIETTAGFGPWAAICSRLKLIVRGVRRASHRRTVRTIQDPGTAEGNCLARHVDLSGDRSDVLRRHYAGVYDQPARVFPRLRDGQQYPQPEAGRLQYGGAPGQQLHHGHGRLGLPDRKETTDHHFPVADNSSGFRFLWREVCGVRPEVSPSYGARQELQHLFLP